jgi:membrane protease YdiL (CAAX protease family)
MGVMGAGICGALVGMMFSMTRRLWLPIFFHAGWNFTQACYGMPISGMKDFLNYSPFQGMLQGPGILTDGAFGLENSVITVALTIIIFVVLYF